jgi:glycine cleavage system aminomethyltransferase T/glycine/D-amino acid oxidase-like deaminating enzyme
MLRARPRATTAALRPVVGASTPLWNRSLLSASAQQQRQTQAGKRSLNTTAATLSASEKVKKSLPKQARVIVVGGGIIGSSVAYHLSHALNGIRAAEGKSSQKPVAEAAASVGSSALFGAVSSDSSDSSGGDVPDVLLLEQGQVTSGTTWHAAGLVVTYGSTSETSTRMRQYTKELYSTTLEEETGLSTGFQPCGFIELATSEDRLHEQRRAADFNRHMGVDVKEISPGEVKERFPLCEVSDVLAGQFVATDGRANPVDATMAYVKGARMQGAVIAEGVRVAGVTKARVAPDSLDLRTGRPSAELGATVGAGLGIGGFGVGAGERVTGVVLENGDVIEADVVVNCAGMWARQFGELAGVAIPNQAAEHYYMLTDAMEDVDPSWPVIEDPAAFTYIRPEGNGLLVGLFESKAAAWQVEGIPKDFSFGEIEPDWDRMTPFLSAAMNRAPRTLEVGMKKFFNGPESFTPDLQPIVGEAPELRNYFVAAGLNSIGILTSGGIGRLLSNWIVDGLPDMDVTPSNINRVQHYMTNPEFRADRVVESLGMVYKCHYPEYAMKTARGVKKSPIYDRLAARGAYFKDVSGFEGANWFAPAGVEPEITELNWNRHNFFPYWKAEHEACRNGVIVMDMSFMSKFLVQGRDAGRVLNRLSTANVDAELGMITYTQWLNYHGRMEADLTVTKLAEDRFFVVATDTMHRHAESWMNRHIPGDAHATVTDVTGAYAQINIQGPLSRSLMQDLTVEDMSDAAFPFRTAREIPVGFARVNCVRITYLGELGYELYVPAEHALHVYDRIVAAGEKHGLVHAGLKALASLRMEKGYRDYGHDMDNTDSLCEVGLGFTCDFDKPGGFIGREHVVAQKEKKLVNLPQRLVQVLVKDPEPFMYHGEVVWRNGERVGDVRAASYGHTLGGAVGLAMVQKGEGTTFGKKFIEEGEWEVEIASKRYPAEVSLKPMYDPANDRIKM